MLKQAVPAVLALALVACATPDSRRTDAPLVATVPVQRAPDAAPKITPAGLFKLAVEAMARKDSAAAKPQLRQIIDGMPADWRPERDVGSKVVITYWSPDDLISCLVQDAQKWKKDIVAVDEPYVQAWYLLAFIALEDGDAAQAEQAIDRALALSPDRALLLNEKATIVQQRHRLDDAIALNRRAIDSTLCVNPAARKTDLSRAWRSIGVALIDEHKFDEADAALSESLKIDPGNRATLNEVVYLERMRGKKPPNAPTVIHRVEQ